jgi:DNA-binding cell septation regulator SpoVG
VTSLFFYFYLKNPLHFEKRLDTFVFKREVTPASAKRKEIQMAAQATNWHSDYQKKVQNLDVDALNHIIEDCRAAIEALPSNPKCGQYTDEIHYCSMELKRRGLAPLPAKRKEIKIATTPAPLVKQLPISLVAIQIVKSEHGRLRAMVRLVVADCLQLTGIRIYDGSNGLFVSYPNDPSHKGDDYRQLFYPVTRDFRDTIEKAVLEAYHAALSE